MYRRITVIDSHTGGEPTRVILLGGPELGGGTLAEQRDRFRVQFDAFRTASCCEPRGSDVIVGALLTEPFHESCDHGVIFFNNVGYLGMCGHGTIGVIETLRHLKRIEPGTIWIDTPVGIVKTELHPNGEVTVYNVESYRSTCDLELEVEGIGKVLGDIAWGGNWFFLVKHPTFAISSTSCRTLIDFSTRIRHRVNEIGFHEVDHVELFDEGASEGAHSRNFVLCPGLAYDRSPCGTGTSAKLACLAADRKLKEGEKWIQESVIGSRFSASFRWADSAMTKILPEITGRAFVMAETEILIAEDDDFGWGIGQRGNP